MQNYRLLKPGETIQPGDEAQISPYAWRKVQFNLGKPMDGDSTGFYRRACEWPNSFDLDFTGYGWLMHEENTGPFLFEYAAGELEGEEAMSLTKPLPITRENLERARTEARQWLELLENLTPID